MKNLYDSSSAPCINDALAGLCTEENLLAMFVRLGSEEGHDFWQNQWSGGITDEGRSALERHLAKAEAFSALGEAA